MSEMKHTSGPWEVGVHPANDRLYIVRPVLFGSKVVVLPECEGGHVALKNSADALLIAAAPDLYVIATHPILEHLIATSDHPSVKAVFEPMRRAAIARATGAVTSA